MKPPEYDYFVYDRNGQFVGQVTARSLAMAFVIARMAFGWLSVEEVYKLEE